jgi:hypothetical protein
LNPKILPARVINGPTLPIHCAQCGGAITIGSGIVRPMEKLGDLVAASERISQT